MKKKYAKYELNGSSFDGMLMEADKYREESEDWIRTSEIIEVEDPEPLPNEVVVPQKVKELDERIKNVRAELGRRVADLEERKARLLAITQQ